MSARQYFLHALSPLHVGTGQSVGAIDLPIARERPTGIPLVPGSSVKGALRAACRGVMEPVVHKRVFGPDKDHASEHAGALQFSDAHLLLLPVRSVAGTFAWVTSPYLLLRYLRDLQETVRGAARNAKLQVPRIAPGECAVMGESALTVEVSALSGAPQARVILEDLDFKRQTVGGETRGLLEGIQARLFPADEVWRRHLAERLCIVADDAMGLFMQHATEVVARVRLEEDTKTVGRGALWYEEALPVESVLSGVLVGPSEGDFNALGAALPPVMQFGGKATTGRGLCILRGLGGREIEGRAA